jgi:hypothetical protein
MDNALFLCAKLFFEDWISDSREPFRNALDKLGRKKLDEMFGMPTEHGKKRWSG